MKEIVKFGTYVLLILLVYVLVNDPFKVPTYGILGRSSSQHGVVILTLMSVFYLLGHKYEFRRFIRVFHIEFVLMFLLIFCSIILMDRVANGLSIGSHIEMLFQTILIPFCLINYAIKNNCIYDENSFVRVILLMSAIGGILSTLCLLNPTFDAYVKEHILQLSEEDKLAGYTFRAFGVASGLLYGYGVAQGIALSLGVFYVSNNKWYLFFVPFVLISILFNARTGLLMPIVAIFIYFCSRGIRLNTIILSVLFVILFIYIRDFVGLLGNEKAVEWVGDFFDQILLVTQSGNVEESSTATHLFRSGLLPETLDEWMIGTGIDISRLSNSSQSDIGFLRQIHYGGLIYCALLYLLVLYMLRRLWRCHYKQLSFFFFITFMIANIKGLYVPISNGFILFSLVYYYLIYNGVRIRMTESVNCECKIRKRR